MCWICAVDKTLVAQNHWGAQLSSLHFETATAAVWAESLGLTSEVAPLSAKATDALLPFDGVGDKAAVVVPTVLIVSPDDIANDTSTTTTVEVGGPSLIGTINTIGDFDFVKVELVAGRTYDIGQYAYLAGPSGVPLADAFIEIYDSAGNLVLVEDGGGPNTPNGLDALATFTAEASGTYYINARAFDQDGTNGSDGDSVGDYELFVKDVTGRLSAPPYEAYYDFDSPLHSLDWGSQIDGTSRNPDGAEGPRPTGNPEMGSANPYGIQGKNVVTYYFARQGDIFLSSDPTTPGLTADMIQATTITDAEKDQYRLAFAQYEEVADIVYLEVFNRNEADLKIITYNGTPGPGASLLGRASPPGEESAGQMEFNRGDERYNEAGLTQGGFFFTTLLHEFGHAHGMAHPHDDGGRSSIMRGAGGGTAGIGGAYGDYGLSQGVFTVMSYNDGWDLRPDGTPKPDDNADNGWVGSLSPLDIAVIQDKYGVNEEYRTGDDVYVLADVQQRGVFYDSIWDAGGTDAIVYQGARNTVIDLRAATLQYEEGGGGRVSYATGINGGYTIANGVTIEQARSGSGNDTLIGNDAANLMFGGGGRDMINGGAGDDFLGGGLGIDTVTGGAGRDVFTFGAIDESGVGVGRDIITDFEQGNDLIELINFFVDTYIGSSSFSGSAGELRAVSFAGSTIIEADTNGDGSADFQVELAGAFAMTIDDFIGVENDATAAAALFAASSAPNEMPLATHAMI